MIAAIVRVLSYGMGVLYRGVPSRFYSGVQAPQIDNNYSNEELLKDNLAICYHVGYKLNVVLFRGFTSIKTVIIIYNLYKTYL